MLLACFSQIKVLQISIMLLLIDITFYIRNKKEYYYNNFSYYVCIYNSINTFYIIKRETYMNK